MGTITKSVDVDVDLTTAYNQWTQFETFPQFMEGVEDVQQITDTELHWVTKVGPVVREFDAVITEQVPEQLIAWESVNGPQHQGRVSFRKLDDDETEIIAEMNIDPDAFVENVGDKAGIIDARVEGDLKRFKSFIEKRGDATGAWRGSVNADSDASASALGTPAEPSLRDTDYMPLNGQILPMGESMPISPLVSHTDRNEPAEPDSDEEEVDTVSGGVPLFDERGFNERRQDDTNADER